MTTTLAEGMQVRPPTMADLEAVTELINVCELADTGEQEFTSDDLRDDWDNPEFQLTKNTILAVAPSMQIVGYTNVSYDRRGMFLEPNTAVHPEYRHQGIEGYLLQWAEERVREYLVEEQPEMPHVIRTVCFLDERRRQLEQAGYKRTMRECYMEIDFAEAPPAPEPIAGITIRPFKPEQEARDVHYVIQTAFMDMHERIPEEFDSWERWALQNHAFDPSLLYVAMDGGEMVGAILCRDYQQAGFISQLGVLRSWRQRGIGLYLLRQVFGDFYRRGIRKVNLSVDSENATGALRFYERADMHVATFMDTYEKSLML